jgi:hypothetical protein
MDEKPFNPAVGERVIATDASGHGHEATVSKAPWRGHSMVVVGLHFDHFPATQHCDIVWPLSAVRAIEDGEGND